MRQFFEDQLPQLDLLAVQQGVGAKQQQESKD